MSHGVGFGTISAENISVDERKEEYSEEKEKNGESCTAGIADGGRGGVT